MAERVIPAHYGAARLILLPGAKLAGRLNCSYGFGVRQHGIELKGLAGSDVFHPQVTDVEFNRELTCLEGIDDQSGLLGNKFIYIDFDFSSLESGVLSLFPGRNVQLEIS